MSRRLKGRVVRWQAVAVYNNITQVLEEVQKCWFTHPGRVLWLEELEGYEEVEMELECQEELL